MIHPKSTSAILILAFLLFFPLTAGAQQARPAANVLIVYYSVDGHTRAMAESVQSGARSVEHVEVVLRSVTDATTEDVLAADAIIVGSPVYNASVAPEVQTFINNWPFRGMPLRDKLGAAFVSAGGISAGEETTQLAILRSMLVFGMVVVGGPDWKQPFGASAVVSEEPFGSQDRKVGGHFLAKAEALGRRVARLARDWKGGVGPKASGK